LLSDTVLPNEPDPEHWFQNTLYGRATPEPGFKSQVQLGVGLVVPGRLRLVFGIRDIFLAGC